MENPCNSEEHSTSAGVQMQRKQGCSAALLNLKEAMVSGQFTTNSCRKLPSKNYKGHKSYTFTTVRFSEK